MQVDVNSIVLAARIYSALHGQFFITDVSDSNIEADGGKVMAAIRNSIIAYVEETAFGSPTSA